MFGSIEEGDLEAGLRAASAIGDDTLQKNHKDMLYLIHLLMEVHSKEWKL